MKGTVFKRCSGCGGRVEGRSCSRCKKSTCAWAFRVRTGKMPNGRWHEEWKGGFATRRDAERALAATITSVNAGSFVQATTLSVGDYLEEWLRATKPPHVKFETWADRRSNLTLHVVPRLGTLRLQEVNASHLNRLYGDLLEDGRVRGEGGLSPTTVRRIHSIVTTPGDSVAIREPHRSATL